MVEKENMSFALKKCICKGCPSYVLCKEKIGYCVYGKSKCIKEEAGCICGNCPVYSKLKLNGGSFCTRGKAK